MSRFILVALAIPDSFVLVLIGGLILLARLKRCGKLAP
jgi:hypothetical protein